MFIVCPKIEWRRHSWQFSVSRFSSVIWNVSMIGNNLLRILLQTFFFEENSSVTSPNSIAYISIFDFVWPPSIILRATEILVLFCKLVFLIRYNHSRSVATSGFTDTVNYAGLSYGKVLNNSRTSGVSIRVGMRSIHGVGVCSGQTLLIKSFGRTVLF